jgi:hypothetical protein
VEATRDFTFGGSKVPAGTYALYTIPGKTTWTVILNKNPGAGGTRGYDEKNDVARVTVTPDPEPGAGAVGLSVRRHHRRRYPPRSGMGHAARLGTDQGRYPAAGDEQHRQGARRCLAAALHSARYLLDSGGDLKTALGYIDTSISIKSTWWNNWTKAQILAKQGKKAEAVVAAEQAQKLGQGDEVYDGFFKDQIAKSIAEWKKPS